MSRLCVPGRAAPGTSYEHERPTAQLHGTLCLLTRIQSVSSCRLVSSASQGCQGLPPSQLVALQTHSKISTLESGRDQLNSVKSSSAA